MFRRPSRYTMMMLFLLGGAASLIGIIISSAATTYHFFGVGVVAQGQGVPGQQLQQLTPEPQLPTLGPKQPGQPIQGQKLGQQILSPQLQPFTIEQMKRQQKQDMELLDRIFPYIIQRIDGKTLAQKIDAATLIQKIDDKTLAAKVLPYLDLKVVAIERPGPKHSIDITGLSGRMIRAKAACAPGESLVGGGFDMRGYDRTSPFVLRKENVYGPNVNSWVAIPNTNTWVADIEFSHDAEFATYAECLKAELTLKEEQQQP